MYFDVMSMYQIHNNINHVLFLKRVKYIEFMSTQTFLILNK